LIVDLKLKGRKVVVIGGGEKAEFKIKKLLDSGAEVTVISSKFSKKIKELADYVKIIKADEEEAVKIINHMKPYLLVAASGDRELDARVADLVRNSCKLVYVEDNLDLSDFSMTAVAKLGDIRIAFSTNGLSPAMSKLLRERVEKLITKEDIMMVKLHGIIRSKIRRKIKSEEERRAVTYKILRNRRIRQLVKRGMLNEAIKYAEEIINVRL